MEIAALHSSRPAADIAPEQLAGDANLTPAQKIAEGARLFEALLLRQILQESQKTVIQSKFADNSTSAGIYRDMITNQLAESISKSGSLGLAKSLEQQLGGQLGPTSSAGQSPPPTASPTLPVGPVTARPFSSDAPFAASASKCVPRARGVEVVSAHRP